MSSVDLSKLGHLEELFARLRRGYHLCADDGALYRALRADYAAHAELFGALGFDLVEHERGFYYFQSKEELGKEAALMVVFFFVLMEAWGDLGKDLEATAFDPAGHAYAGLPHLSRESWRRCMAEIQVTTPDELEGVVRKMDRYGFVTRVDDERFRFRPPAWRFFDLCRDIWAETAAAREEASDRYEREPDGEGARET